jgi:hypothetical protein
MIVAIRLGLHEQGLVDAEFLHMRLIGRQRIGRQLAGIGLVDRVGVEGKLGHVGAEHVCVPFHHRRGGGQSRTTRQGGGAHKGHDFAAIDHALPHCFC